MEFMQSSSSAGRHGIGVDDSICNPEEGINGNWQPHSSSHPTATLKPLHSPNHTSRMQSGTGKGKEMSDSLQKTPRRMAASKAMEQVMKKSASSAITTTTSPAKEFNIAEVMSSTYASSPASLSQKSPFTRGIAGQQRLKSSSPLPPIHSNGDLERCSSSSTSTAAAATLLEIESSPLEIAELGQFHFQATPDSNTNLLPRPPPNLPYDPTYLPLSPNGVDQIGHVLGPMTSNLSEQQQNGGPKGLNEIIKHGKGQAHLNKKILPGQELEEHVVSHVSGHRAMPWGLKATLLEKQLGGERAKTRMGSLKRNVRRDHRRDKLPNTVKAEDDIVSDADSPQLPLIEISEVTANMPAVLDLEEQAKGENVIKGQNDIEPSSLPNEDQQQNRDIIVAHLQSSIDSQEEISPNSDPAPDNLPSKKVKARRSRALQLDASPTWSANIHDEQLASESSSQEGALSESNTKRPREAHKRLKIVGGYYSKLSLHREISQGESDSKTSNGQPSGASGSISRGTSFAPDDQKQLTQNEVEDTVKSSSIDQPASSPPRLSSKQATNTLRRMTAAHDSPSKLIHASGEAMNADTNGAVNNEYCETCRGSGHFICCDGCPRSFHFACIDPPLDIDELPNSIGDEADTWFCNVCCAARQGAKIKQKSGLFHSLIRLTETTNPTIFALPADIRNYFKGVATANDGSYVNSSMLRPIKVNKLGVVEEREPLRLKDKNGKPILCFHCGESAMPAVPSIVQSPYRWKERPFRKAAEIANAAVTSQSSSSSSRSADLEVKKEWRKVISCDFCNLHWHLDCLNPPLATMPSLARKWMCPNHIEHAMPLERIPKSVANSLSIHELPIPSLETIGPGKHYRMRVINDGQIDIIPDPMDTYTGPAHDVPGLPNSTSGANGKFSGSGEKGWDEVTATLPAYKAYPTAFGTQNNIKFKYKIPEKVIRLDFWSAAELQREKLAEAMLRNQEKSQKDALDLLAIVANAASLEEKSQEKMQLDKSPKLSCAMTDTIVKTIFSSSKKQEEHPYIKPGEEPISLLRQSYVPGEYEREFEGFSETSNHRKSASTSTQNRHHTKQLEQSPLFDQIDQKEVAKLQAIQKLIAYKGKDALLRFLLDE